MIAVGVGFLLKYDDVLEAFKDVNVNVAPIAFIVIGAAIFLIAFFGCCGAIFESECMVSTVSKLQIYDIYELVRTKLRRSTNTYIQDIAMHLQLYTLEIYEFAMTLSYKV